MGEGTYVDVSAGVDSGLKAPALLELRNCAAGNTKKPNTHKQTIANRIPFKLTFFTGAADFKAVITNKPYFHLPNCKLVSAHASETRTPARQSNTIRYRQGEPSSLHLSIFHSGIPHPATRAALAQPMPALIRGTTRTPAPSLRGPPV